MSEKEYIERDRLIHHLEYCIDDIRNTNGFTEDFEICLRAVQNQPTADVQEVRHGEWRKIQNYALCGFCKHKVNWGSNDFLSPYCPNCGAKMKNG